ncbi:MAG: flagellar hook-basal body complex protein FliE [Pseudomonadota bacterium]
MNIESIAANQLYGTTQALNSAFPPNAEVDDESFADALQNALAEMRSTVERGEKAAVEAMTGKGDTQSVVEALVATEMALETAVSVRDKVVEAYQEILRMPV